MTTRARSGAVWFVLLAVLLAGALWAGRDPAAAQQPGDDALLRELAERALGSGGGFGGFIIAGSGGERRLPPFQRAELYPGSLPPGIGFEVPLPPDARLIGSVVHERFGRQIYFQVVLDVPATAGGVVSFYERELLARGWTRASSLLLQARPPTRGFVDDELLMTAERIERLLEQAGSNEFQGQFCIAPRGPDLMVSVVGEEHGVRDVRILSSGFPCDLGRRGGGAAEEPPLPLLRIPSGAVLSGLGGSSSGEVPVGELPPPIGGESASPPVAREATVLSALDVAALEEGFAAQLAAQGWTRQDGGASDLLAWSTWTRADPREWFGFLTVTAEPDQSLRVLRFQVRPRELRPPPRRGPDIVPGGE